MADLSVNIKDLKLKNPVMTASGTFGYGLEFADFVPLEEIGVLSLKVQLWNLVREMTIRVWQKHLRECLIAWDFRIRV